MPSYAPPIDDYQFLLHEVLRVGARGDIAGFGDLEPAFTRQILEGAGAFLAGEWQPLNQVGDEEGCRLENGVVRTPAGFAEAYRAYCDAGWNRLSAPEQFGGAGLPGVIAHAVHEMASSANASLSHYPGLTNGAFSSLALTGAPWMLEHVAPRMVSGDWCGTMCLTEPHCGTDLRLMSTRAVAQADGSYRISGTKIFISGGDHDLSKNIIHLVLAKLPDENGRYSDDLATVNLFMVPKVVVDPETGRLGARNGVSVGGIEKKMGLKGSATCVLNFDEAVGYRLGTTKANAAPGSKSAAMSGMFHMMNHARLGTGLGAIAAAEVAYQNSALYAQERRSGRAASPEARSDGAADPIIVHPDVRRMLLQQRAFVEGARAAALWVAELLHEEQAGQDAARRERAAALGQLLTPVIKAYFTDRGFEAVNAAVQVFGGHGYIRENGVEQFVRDARIYQLYEGANGIQAFDLVARKLPAGDGRAVAAFFEELETVVTAAAWASSDLGQYGSTLRSGRAAIEDVMAWLRTRAPEQAETLGAASYDVLNLFGVVLLGMLWLRIAAAAEAQLAAGQGDPVFLRRKLVLARYWFEREMPAVESLVRRAKAGADGLMALAADAF
ncbi:acyl-CoA dehydrogenase C-terminal domain-containing protein [Caulobacter sp. KR2-114]|jgi:alkylation response protein AidB-like acyl-CoA dehydrogenase|uniref:acyl-CoA dehydrogenase C-terminal domain-containing protein n=1 Tax=Caulobacter sp. KR2-114 TaxID=3400912 RepID=UPI003C02266A